MKILFLGYIIGISGCSAVEQYLPEQIKKNRIDFVIVNGENCSEQGVGITEKIANNLFSCGVNVITSGNHIWDQKETANHIEKEDRLLRPHNSFSPAPGKGFQIFTLNDGLKIGILNLMGNVFMKKSENVFEAAKKLLCEGDLSGRSVVVTAGGTREPIDPVRFIGNHSSGLMGYELAEYASKLGAEVVLISGPTSLVVADETIKKIGVGTAVEMNKAVLAYFEASDIFIGAAAVADYRPTHVCDQKIKKESLANPNIELIKNPDIIAGLGKIRKHQFLLGFALETQDVLNNGTKKLQSKNLDAIVLNSLKDSGAGFGHKTNKVQFLSKKNGLKSFPLKSKKAVAIDIWNEILKEL